MLDKLNRLTVAVYLSMTSFVQDLKNDERGLSGVVVAVLLILGAVLALTMIWGLLNGWLSELWDNITGKASEIQ